MTAQAHQNTEPVSGVLRDIGRPVAYYPGLAPLLGGVKAALLFCQLRYWQSRVTGGRAVHKTSDELCAETGLSYEEQRTARRCLKKAGVLIETEKRLEHTIYFSIDEAALAQLMENGQPQAGESDEGGQPGKRRAFSRTGESPVREMDFAQSANRETPCPPGGQPRLREQANAHSVKGKTTARLFQDYSSSTCVRETAQPVDNFDVAAAALTKDDKPHPEREVAAQLVALETARGKPCLLDSPRDRAHVLGWVSRGVTAEQLREAHRRAVAARERDRDSRAVNAGFLSRFIDEVLAKRDGTPTQAGTVPWWLGGETAVCAEGARLGVRPKRADESLPEYRVRVAKAAGRGPWIEHVLKDAQRPGYERIYRNIINFFGTAMLPTDSCALNPMAA